MNNSDIAKTLTSMANSFDKELYNLTEDELFDSFDPTFTFEYDPDNGGLTRTIFDFYERLEVYKNRCIRWESHHNGHSMSVDRAVYKFIYPKIQDFIHKLQDHGIVTDHV